MNNFISELVQGSETTKSTTLTIRDDVYAVRNSVGIFTRIWALGRARCPVRPHASFFYRLAGANGILIIYEETAYCVPVGHSNGLHHTEVGHGFVARRNKTEPFPEMGAAYEN